MSEADLRSRYLELHKLVGETLLNKWDPVGIAGTPEARGEYDSYVPQVISLMEGGAGMNEVADMLRRIANEQMGLYPDEAPTVRAAGKCLDAWRACMDGSAH